MSVGSKKKSRKKQARKPRVKDLLDFVEAYTGKLGREVFQFLLKRGEEVSDEELKEKLGVEREDELRRVLYELHSLGPVVYRRVHVLEQNRYIFMWKVDVNLVNQALLQRKKEVLERLRARLSYEESTTFYVCPRCGNRLSFEEAMENDFTCPRCGEMLVYEDNSDIKEVLRKLVNELEKEIEVEERALYTN